MSRTSLARRLAATLASALALVGCEPAGPQVSAAEAHRGHGAPPGRRFVPPATFDVLPAELGAGEAALRIALHVAATIEESSRAGGSVPPEPGLLADEVAAALEVYLVGSTEAFVEHALARGLDVSWVERLDADGELDEVWEPRSRALRLAPLATDGIDVRPRLLAGREVPVEKDGPSVHAHRPGRVPDVTDPAVQRLDLYEVRVPARIAARRDDQEITFPGRFGMGFLWLGEGRGWVLHEIRLYDPPEGTALSMPPL